MLKLVVCFINNHIKRDSSLLKDDMLFIHDGHDVEVKIGGVINSANKRKKVC